MKLSIRINAAILAATMLAANGAMLGSASENEPGVAFAQNQDWDDLDLEAIEHIEGFVDEGVVAYSDEEFYGQYDEYGESWINPGYLDYDNYPELELVKEAAKTGDYTTAKQELLEYYRELYSTYTPAYNKTKPNARQIYSAYAVKNNFQLNTSMIPAIWGIPVLSDEYQYIEIDITDRISAILSQPEPITTVQLFGLRKDGTSLEFESINALGEHPPVVEVTSKGVTQRIVATDDATISPMANYNKCYGSEPILQAEESESSIGLSRLTDSNTKRTLIKFDFSSIDKATTPTRAVLKLYGRNVSGKGSGELLAIEFSNNSWEEEEVTFYFGKAGVTMEHATFSNYGEDTFRFDGGVAPDRDGSISVFAYRYPEELLRFSWAEVLAQLYQYDYNEEYVLTFLDQWVGYLEQRGRYPRYDKTLDGHCRDKVVAQIMSTMINSEYVTPDIWSATMKYYLMEIRAQIDGGNDEGNWGSYQINGLTALAIYAPTLTVYEEAISVLQEWVAAKIDEAFYEDGSGIEIEWGYSFGGTFTQLLQANKMIKNANLPATIFPDNMQEIGERIINYFASFLLPGGGNPQIGDGAGYTGKSYKSESRNEILYASFDLPYWQWLATDGKEGTAPYWTTARYSGSLDPDEFLTGVYTMRSDWGENATYMYTDVDGNMTPGHGHKDDLQTVVKAYGQYLLVDPSFTSYASNAVPLSSTKYHNTVFIDDSDQIMTKTAYEMALDEPIKKEKRFETNALYDNITMTTPQNGDHYGLHTRNILFIKPGFWIINDYLEPTEANKTHKYQQHWHMLPEADPTMDIMGVGRSNFGATANIQVAQASMDGITATIEDGYFGAGTGRLYDSEYLRYEKNSTGKEIFNTVVFPEHPGERAEVSATEYALSDVSDNGAVAMNVNITSDTGTYIDADYYLVHDLNQQAERSFGNYKTDARSVYIGRNSKSNVSEVFLQDTTVITDNKSGTELFKSEEPIKELGYKKEAYRMTMASSKPVNLEKLTIYVEDIDDIKEVSLNGEKVSYKTSGRYIYFGSEPILTDEEYETATPKPSQGSSGGGGGGGGHAVSAKPKATEEPTATEEPAATQEPDETTDTIPESYLKELEKHWGYDELKEAVEKGILKGIDENTLALDISATRAQFVTLLVRALEMELSEYNDEFLDVSKDDWYAPYIKTAYENGFVQGVSKNMFDPDREISREEMAKIISLVYQTIVQSESTDNEVSAYSDDASISQWAKEYVYIARDAGILKGDNNMFRPKDSVTRAEATASLLRIRNIKEMSVDAFQEKEGEEE